MPNNQERRALVRKKTAVACAKKLEAAADALHAFVMACNECDDGSRDRGVDDGRRTLQGSMREYSHYLDSAFNK